MEEKGTREREGFFERVRDHAHHGADMMKQIRFPKLHGAESKEDGVQAGGPLSTGENSNKMDSTNVEDFPYDSNRDDEFTSELLCAAGEEEDGIGSPKSQCSMDTLYSSASNASWTSTQKNVGGIGLKEGRSQEVLGPYKNNIAEEGSEAVPSEYQNYVDDQKKTKPSMNGGTASVGNHLLERSSSTASDRSVPDSLYADLSSISDRDIHVPEGLVAEVYDSVSDPEGRTSPNRPAHVRQHISNLKLH